MKVSEGVAKPAVRPSKIRNLNKHMGFDKENLSEYWRVFQ